MRKKIKQTRKRTWQRNEIKEKRWEKRNKYLITSCEHLETTKPEAANHTFHLCKPINSLLPKLVQIRFLSFVRKKVLTNLSTFPHSNSSITFGKGKRFHHHYIFDSGTETMLFLSFLTSTNQIIVTKFPISQHLMDLLKVFFFFLLICFKYFGVFFGSTGSWTQGFMYASQLFYHFNHDPSFKVILQPAFK
jgi:hypothetical protein